MSKLTRRYLLTHMSQQSGASATAEEADAARAFADKLIDQLLISAQGQFQSDEEEKSEIEFSVPVTLRPVVNAPMGGCVEVCIGIGIAQVCYHRGFRGDRPGEG